MRRQLAEKVDVREVAHVEQLAVFSDPQRVHPGPARSRPRSSASSPPTPTRSCPATPHGTPSTTCPDTAFDHALIVGAARDRLRAKLSYTNLGFALAPAEFTISALRELYVAALGHPVSATNLQRVLTRRDLLEPTGATGAARTGRWTARGAVPVHRPACR